MLRQRPGHVVINQKEKNTQMVQLEGHLKKPRFKIDKLESKTETDL